MRLGVGNQAQGLFLLTRLLPWEGVAPAPHRRIEGRVLAEQEVPERRIPVDAVDLHPVLWGPADEIAPVPVKDLHEPVDLAVVVHRNLLVRCLVKEGALNFDEPARADQAIRGAAEPVVLRVQLEAEAAHEIPRLDLVVDDCIRLVLHTMARRIVACEGIFAKCSLKSLLSRLVLVHPRGHPKVRGGKTALARGIPRGSALHLLTENP